MYGWETKTAFLLGLMHSLEPSHGTSAMAVFMLDKKNHWQHSLILALSTVFSHGLVIFTIAAFTHTSGHLIFGNVMDDAVSERIKKVSAITLILIGMYLLFRPKKNSHNSCKKHANIRTKVARKINLKLPFLLGASIGLVPCPSVVAVFITSLGTGNTNLGMQAILWFSLGSFISILVCGFLLRWIGEYSGKIKYFNTSTLPWTHLQGAIISTIGLFYLFSE
ncbi:MAG: sulfite exporter TauE/SafE family protein [Oligoflexales bacterium]